jgi:membrane fusion protein (multidrug efflux system)
MNPSVFRSAKKLVAILATLALFLGAGCSGGEDAQAQNPPHGGGSGGQGGGRGERPEQPPIPVAIATAERGNIATSYAATATLEAEKEATVLARVNGVVETLFAEEGDQLRAGEPLLQIDNDEYRLRVAQARANREKLEAVFKRQSEMAERKLVSEEEFESTRSELAAAKAAEELAFLDDGYTSVKAPFSGIVTRRFVDVGQNLQAGTELFTIADFDPLLARIHVPAKEFGRLQKEQPVRLTLDSDGTELRGHIRLISPVIDPTTGTIKLTVEIATVPAAVRPGDFAHAFIVTERRENALLVPRDAVISEKGEDVVYVALDELAERRVVSLGFVDELHAQILDGVSDGEAVVIKGQRSLKHGAPIKILDGGFAPAERQSS